MKDLIFPFVFAAIIFITGALLLKPSSPAKFKLGEHVRRKYVTEESHMRFHGNVLRIQAKIVWRYLIIAPDGQEGWWDEDYLEHDDRYDPPTKVFQPEKDLVF